MARSTLRSRLIARAVSSADALTVGGTYFLSSFYDKTGATVKVLPAVSREHKKNYAFGIVPIEVLECISDGRGDSFHQKLYAAGTLHSVNARNLFVNREDASHTTRFKGVNVEKYVRGFLRLGK